MRLLIPASIVFFIGAIKANNNDNKASTTADIALFEEWTKKFGKEYSSTSEKDYRMSVWLDNNQFIEEHNAKGLSWTCGHNQLSDLTHEEMIEYYNLNNNVFSHIDEDDSNKNSPWKFPAEDFVESFEEFSPYATTSRRLKGTERLQDNDRYLDWTELGAVVPVKDQKQCGSCWAFSAMSSLESAKFLKDGELVSLSEQHLVDCDEYDYSCGGGWYTNAWKFLKEAGGSIKENDYPYKWRKEHCAVENLTKVPNTLPVSWGYASPRMNDHALKNLVQRMPVVVALHATAQDFMLYKEGIYDGECEEQINHGVNIVGFGEEQIDGQTVLYWKFKNSWSTKWGEGGFMRIKRDDTQYTGKDPGKCGILKWPAWVGV